MIAFFLVALLLGSAGAVIAVALLMSAVSTTGAVDNRSVSDSSCTTLVAPQGRSAVLTDEQRKNAASIIETGSRLGVPRRGVVVAIATALQESNLRNLSWGDRDSVGLFQQRSAWGSFAERTDPVTSATLFYTGGRAGQPGLFDIRGWESMSVTMAAQAVQRSAFPFAYAKWEMLAHSLVGSAKNGGVDCPDGSESLPAGALGEMMRVAVAQLGDPYVWGATGPDAFDCSGLVVYSWRMAGYKLSVRTADQMYRISTPVRPGEERPGDLLFGSFGTRVPGAGHMMVVVRPGVALQAPRAGRSVELTTYDVGSETWRIGRLPSSSLTRLGANPSG
jgi:cell wall-associated NlpC family hydrolase